MSEWREKKRFAEVTVQEAKGPATRRMAYVEQGEGPPVLLLHGNPTSSYLWRDVMAALPQSVRAIAPDLIGMGDSDKLPESGPDRYRFVEHRAHLDALLDQLLPPGPDAPKVLLVVHDWGSALGFDWARRNAHRVRGIAYMEAIVRPMGWAEWPDAAKGIFDGLRSEAGEEMVLEKNLFVERILPASIQRPLTEAEMAEYRRPFAEPGESRRPTLAWPRQIPFDAEPNDVHVIVQAYYDFLRISDIPKLFINAEPGSILIGPMRDSARGFRNQREITVPGLHFIQEDSGAEIGSAIAEWMESL